jgi:FLVCR family feline leukemia virus subgroup C receptor-related protein
MPELPVRHNFESRLTPYRWAIVFFFAMNITAISCMSLSMSPQSTLLKYGYGVGTQEVNMCSTIFSATYIPMTFATMWLYTRIPSSYVIRIGCCFFLSGCWIRGYSDRDGAFWPILLGQFWMSFAYPIFNAAINLICNKWFPDKERTLVTALCGLAIPSGNIFAFTMSGLIFAGLTTESPREKIRRAEMKLILIQNIWITCVTVPLFILIRDKPTHPPSLVAMQDAKKINFCASLGQALKSRNYNLMLLAFFCIDGSFIGFGSVLGTIFGGTVLGTGQTSLLSGTTVLLGLISSFTSGAIVQKRKNFRLMMRLSCFGCLVCFTFAIFTFLRSTDGVLISINILIMGIFIVPIIPIGINFSSELTFPIEPTVITGTLMMVGQLGGLILALLAGFLSDTGGSEGIALVWGMFACLGFVGSVCSIIIKEDLKKTNFNSSKVQHIATDRNDEVAMFK